MICVVFLNFSQINAGNIEIHTVQTDSNNFGLYNFLFFAKVSDYRAVGLSRHRTIDTHPNEWITVFFFIVHAMMERYEFINGNIN